MQKEKLIANKFLLIPWPLGLGPKDENYEERTLNGIRTYRALPRVGKNLYIALSFNFSLDLFREFLSKFDSVLLANMNFLCIFCIFKIIENDQKWRKQIFTT